MAKSTTNECHTTGAGDDEFIEMWTYDQIPGWNRSRVWMSVELDPRGDGGDLNTAFVSAFTDMTHPASS